MATQDQQNRNSIPQSRQSLDYNMPQQTFKVQGMKTDLSESSAENNFAFENKNMRINIVDDDNTLMNLTNERGTKYVEEIKGIPIGVKKYDYDKALIFTTENTGDNEIEDIKYVESDEIVQTYTYDIQTNIRDHIFDVQQKDGNIKIQETTSDNSRTSFSAHHPLEIEHYKDSDKDYFYLADGINNFKKVVKKGDSVESFEYNDMITGSETISVSQKLDSSGEFYSGVIIYCFAYITQSEHKTGIIDISNIQYNTNYVNKEYQRRGLAPNTRCNISYDISLKNLSNKFKAVEVYSLFRSTLNGEIVVREVKQIPISNSTATIYDQNKGKIISYQELLTRFNSLLAPSTLTQKSSTLFLGNIKTDNFENLKSIAHHFNADNVELEYFEEFHRQLKSVEKNSRAFLKGNIYYIGIQFQDIYGNWSPVCYVNYIEKECNLMTVNSELINKTLDNGFIAARAMLLDNLRIRNNVCDGIMLPAITIENGKYGIDVFSSFFCEEDYTKDIHKSYEIETSHQVFDIYSPDIEFDEDFKLTTNDDFSIKWYDEDSNISHPYTKHTFIDVSINGNTGILYNNSSTSLGTCGYDEDGYYWIDAITGYQKALQILLWNGDREHNLGTNFVMPLLYMSDIKESPSKYVIYTWQPSGSLNDSNGKTSVMKSKKISKYYWLNYGYSNNFRTFGEDPKTYLYDKTSNNIPLKTRDIFGTAILVYAGSVNLRVYPHSWSIDKAFHKNDIDGHQLWDDDQIEICDGYSLATLPSVSFVGQPVEFYRYETLLNEHKEAWRTSALWKLIIQDGENPKNIWVKWFRDDDNAALGAANLPCSGDTLKTRQTNYSYEKKDYIYNYENTPETDTNSTSRSDWNKFPIKINVTNNYNRSGNINITYKTPKHLVGMISHNDDDIKKRFCKVELKNKIEGRELSDIEIETGQWIVCSQKVKLEEDKELKLKIDLNEHYTFTQYQCLKTEPYSTNDENQATCVIGAQLESYINPLCRYDKFDDIDNFNGMTSAIFNKMNMVYNQKNNFFIFSGITKQTATDNTIEKTILYSDMKVANEKEDSFVNFNTTNFFTIDSNIDKINKLMTYNNELIAFGNNSMLKILYNENVVINTDSVQSLGLASTDKVSGTQLITNTYGCLNKWSIGISNNILYFNDDLNKKMFAYNGEFSALNETCGIETLNNRFLKNKVWNPVDFNNTKLNIDNFGKDVHYTGKDIDIAFNQPIGGFSSLYSYEKIPYMEMIGDDTFALKTDGTNTKLYVLRKGDYNKFFGKFEPYWTTVIVNQNSLMNKAITNIEFSTEAYDGKMLMPMHDYTFDHITFWNDYQENSMKLDYKMYGQSLLKKKFRTWRINRFRNSTKMLQRNYDVMSNTWHYLKLSTEIENTNKLTLHWLNVNYR